MKKNKQCYNDDSTRLLIKATQGDMRAFEKFYVALVPAVHNYLTKLDASIDYHRRQDLVQEAFFRTWNNLADFRGDASGRTYLLSIAKNVMHEDQLFRKKNPLTCVDDVGYLVDTITGQASTHGPILDHSENFKKIEQAIAKLSPPQSQAIDLADIQNLTTIEASRLAGCSLEQFANRLHRARKRLKKLMALGD